MPICHACLDIKYESHYAFEKNTGKNVRQGRVYVTAERPPRSETESRLDSRRAFPHTKFLRSHPSTTTANMDDDDIVPGQVLDISYSRDYGTTSGSHGESSSACDRNPWLLLGSPSLACKERRSQTCLECDSSMLLTGGGSSVSELSGNIAPNHRLYINHRSVPLS